MRNGEVTADRVAGPDPSDLPTENPRWSRRLRRARAVCVWSVAFIALLVPLWALGGAFLASRVTEGTLLASLALALGIVATAVSAFLALLLFRMVRDRMDGRRVPLPRRYRMAGALLLLVCVLMWFTPYVFFVCGSVWAVLILLAPREHTIRITVALTALPWLNHLASPIDAPFQQMLLVFLSAVVFSLSIWFFGLAILYMWDSIREALDGERARARLAVSEERLRFTEEMRGLLGQKLGALGAGAGRAGRHVRSDPERARAEIEGVHDLARSTLRQVRSVVSGYRDVDLEAEVASVRAVLEANGTAITVVGLRGLRPPPDTAALAAWVVREGGTNVLRHSEARRCRISFTTVEGAGATPWELVVEVANDRAGESGPDERESAGGLVGLTDRIVRCGGALAADRTNDGGFLLRAVLPLSDGPGVRLNENDTDRIDAGSPEPLPDRTVGDASEVRTVAPPRDATPALTEDERRDRRIRTARRVITGVIGFNGLVLVVFPLLDAGFAPMAGAPVWPSAVGSVLSVPIAVLLIVLLRERMDGDRHPSPKLYWASLVLLMVIAVLLNDPVNGLLTIGAWWALGAFLAPRRTTVYVTVALLLSPLPLAPTFLLYDGGLSVLNPLLYGLVWLGAVVVALTLAASTLGMIWLWDISREAVAAQRARAQLAVTEERLRFARDMHDLLGHSLSALAVKAQLAGRLVDRAPDRAGQEMAEVQALARQALHQVRSAVSGYREVDLEGEVDSVVAVLESGGTRSNVTGLDGLELSPKIAGLAAWVVREGGTNVMRHSDADECQIGFTITREGSEGPKGLVVEVYNDRARDEKGDGSGGNGLAGLSERVSMGGGTLSGARTRDGGFLLRAVIPL